MNSSEQHPISDEEARRLAKGLVRLFRSPLKLLGTRGFDEPLTIADAIRIGGLFLAALNVATGRDWLKEKNREFLTQLAENIYLPDEMEKFLYARIKERAENPSDINEAIEFIERQLAGPGAVRKLIHRVLKEALPKPRRGRPTEFNPDSDPDLFLALSTTLVRVCNQFLGLREQFPTKTDGAIIDFLESENPKGAALVRKHEGYISRTINELDFRILKSRETKVQRLADAVAGRELFKWSFTYAIQKAGEFRRSKGIDPEE